LFSVTFAAYSDGSVVLESADALPLWVNLTRSEESGKTAYEIIPLNKEVEDWRSAFTLSEAEYTAAENSYTRTMSVLGEGLEKVRLGLEGQTLPVNE
jgi:hypothetical protein